jgi:hypothetical protein
LGFGVGLTLQALTHLFGDVDGYRTGMGLFLGYAKPR